MNVLNMNVVVQVVLFLHILSGFMALISGFFSLVSKKGGLNHRRSGKIFVYAMAIVCITSVMLSMIRNNSFLFFISVFSFYQFYMGRRAIYNKELKPSIADWVILLIATVNSLFMIISMDIVLSVFGIVNAVIASGNWNRNLKIQRAIHLPANSWLKVHIGMMIGSYIATLTAFLVVNSGWFGFLNLHRAFFWFLPTIVLVPMIVYWTRRTDFKIIKRID
jgi:uncharacterized membrane protein